MGPGSAPATYALIAATTIASLYAFVMDRSFAAQFAFNIAALRERRQHYRIFTSSFVHADLLHFALNMLTLFFFGPAVERLLGSDGLLVVYFGAVMASGVVSYYVNRKKPAYTSLGASDGVSGVVLAFCVFYPLKGIYFFLIPFPIPAILFAALFIALSAGLMAYGRDTRIAHEAHIAGALAGAALTIAQRPDVLTGLFS